MGRRSGAVGGLFLALFQRGQLHKRVELLQQKITAGESQHFIDTRACVPNTRKQRFTLKIRNVVEQGADFGGQQVLHAGRPAAAVRVRPSSQ